MLVTEFNLVWSSVDKSMKEVVQIRGFPDWGIISWYSECSSLEQTAAQIYTLLQRQGSDVFVFVQ